jgi:ATP-independent RNA helicase DbpA
MLISFAYFCAMNTSSVIVEHLMQKLSLHGMNELQQATMKASSSAKNLVLLSPTGSGKTLAFLLPMVCNLNKYQKGIQAVILAPSRELALQIDEVFKRMGTGYKITCCYGGHPVKIEMNNLAEPPSVLVGTPGRILDHWQRGSIDLSNVQMLVLDEFDKCLDMGFTNEMSLILTQIKNVRKRFLTSATNLDEFPDFTGISDATVLNFLEKSQTNNKLVVKKVQAWQTDKLSVLFSLICKLGDQSVIVFLNHRESVERVAMHLSNEGIVNDIFHGGLEQKERERAFVRFRNGSNRILITTDLAARGLDIPMVDAVVHYHIPVNKEAYIHRNGRTARMNAHGTAYVIVGPEEVLPEFIPDNLHFESLPSSNTLPVQPRWGTLYIGKGKKDKINKVDIVGFLCQKGGLGKDEIGLIDVKDNFAYVAVSRTKMEHLVAKLRSEKLKNKNVKIEIAF